MAQREVVVVAHRGLSAAVTGGPHDENSLAAFARAVDAGATHLETDVRVTSDGVALAFHDPVLDRVTDARGLIARREWARVREARIGGVEPIPTLEQVLGEFPGVTVNIDVKSDAGVEPTLAVLARTGAHHRVVLAAFSDRRLARLRDRVGPAVTTCLGPAAVARLRLLASGGRVARPLSPAWANRRAQVPARVGALTVVDRRFVETAHRLHVPVDVWTVNDPPRMRELADLGVDGIVTDRTDLAVPLFSGRTT